MIEYPRRLYISFVLILWQAITGCLPNLNCNVLLIVEKEQIDLSDRMRFEDFVPVAREMLEDGIEYSFEVPNSDMMPTLRDFYDTVTVAKSNTELHKNDVVLYQKDSGEYAVSRIVYINGETYSLSCDGLSTTEYNIHENQIIGIMTSFQRKDKTINVENKYYLYYMKALPFVKIIYSFYASLKTKIQNFIKTLFDR